MAAPETIASLDPVFGSAQATSGTIINHVYETLLDRDLFSDALELTPVLAEAWEVSSDGLSYTFQLQEGVEFHDGTPFDADAVKANFDRWLDESSEYYSEAAAAQIAPFIGPLASTSVEDTYTLSVTLESPFGSFLSNLSDRRLSIISPAALEQYSDEELENNLVGTGPYVFTSRDQNLVRLDKNASYWGTEPYLDELVFQSYLDPTARVQALKTGEVDLSLNLSSDELRDLEADPGDVEVAWATVPNLGYFWLNTRDGPTSDRSVRQALNYAIDREGIINAVFGSEAARAASAPIPQGNPVWSEDLEAYPHDLERARDLLEQADVELPIQLNLLFPTSGLTGAYAEQVALILQQDLAELQVEVTYESMELSTYIETIRVGLAPEAAGAMITWVTNTHDPYWLEQMYATRFQPPSGNNRSWYSNSDVDSLLEQARAEVDDTARLDLYHQAAEIIAEDAPWLWMFQPNLARAHAANVRGFVSTPSLHLDLTEVWLED